MDGITEPPTETAVGTVQAKSTDSGPLSPVVQGGFPTGIDLDAAAWGEKGQLGEEALKQLDLTGHDKRMVPPSPKMEVLE